MDATSTGINPRDKIDELQLQNGALICDKKNLEQAVKKYKTYADNFKQKYMDAQVEIIKLNNQIINA